MKGIHQFLLALVAALPFLTAIGLGNALAGPSQPVVRVSQPTKSATFSLSVQNIPEPGLASWTIDVSWDADIIEVLDCQAYKGSVCVTSFDADTSRVTGAAETSGLTHATFATFAFRCLRLGTSEVSIDIVVLTDSTVGDDDIDAAIENETLICASVSPTATTTVAPQPTATAPPILPPTGTDARGNSTASWPIAALAAFGLTTVVVGASALRRRA